MQALVQGKRDGLMAGPVVHAALLQQNVHKKVSLFPTVFHMCPCIGLQFCLQWWTKELGTV